MNIFVANLSYDTQSNEVKELFEQHGAVDTVKIITDRDTGKSKGFGFVEMPDDGAGNAAIKALDGFELNGRTMNVKMAAPRESNNSDSFRFRRF